MNWDELKERLKLESPDSLVSALLDLPVPYVFQHAPEQLDALKAHMASRLKLNPRDEVRIIGSGLTGFSTGPDNCGSPFSDNSDVDVVVISTDLFDSIGVKLLDWRYPWHIRRFPQSQIQWAREVAENMTSGYIDPLRLKYPTVTGLRQVPTMKVIVEAWFSSLRSTTIIPSLATRNVSGRLYRSGNHLRKYLVNSLSLIKSKQLIPE